MLLFSPEQKKVPDTGAERIHRTFEYKDAKGQKICDVELVLGPKESIPTGNPAHGRKVESYVLHYQQPGQEGKKEQLDLVKFAQRRLLSPTPTYIVEESGFAYHSEFKHIVVLSESRLKSVLGPATLLHEYGHAEQEQDPRFADTVAASSLKVIAESGYEKVSLSMVDKLRGVLSEDQAERLTQSVSRLRELETKRISLEVRVDLRTKELESLRSSGEMDAKKIDTIKMLERVVVESRAGLVLAQEQTKTIFAELEPLFYLPVQILERNATARALLSLRELRDVNGLNLLVPAKRDVADIGWSEKEWLKQKKGIDCETVVVGTFTKILGSLFGKKPPTNEVTSTAEERLIDYALSTYEATTPELLAKYGHVPTPLRSSSKAVEISDIELEALPETTSIKPPPILAINVRMPATQLPTPSAKPPAFRSPTKRPPATPTQPSF